MASNVSAASLGLERPPAVGQQVRPRRDPRVVGELLAVLEEDHPLEGGELGQDLLPALQEPAVLDHRHLRLAVGGDVLDLLRGQGVVERDARRPGVHGGEVGQQVLDAVAGHDRHEVAPADAEGPKAHRRLGSLLPVLAPGEGGVGACPVLPRDRRQGPCSSALRSRRAQSVLPSTARSMAARSALSSASVLNVALPSWCRPTEAPRGRRKQPRPPYRRTYPARAGLLRTGACGRAPGPPPGFGRPSGTCRAPPR